MRRNLLRRLSHHELASRWGRAWRRRTARRTVPAALTALRLHGPVTVDGLAEAVGAHTGRPVRLVAAPGLGRDDGTCAVTLPVRCEDVILYAPGVTRLHRDQFILHELAHITLGHTAGQPAPEAVSCLFPDLPAGTVYKMLTRACLHSPDEEAAEMLADRFAGLIRRGGTSTPFEAVFG